MNTRIAALRSFYRWGIAEGLVKRDPTAGLRMKKKYPPPRAPLSIQELGALSRAADGALEQAVLYLLMDTAIRRSELLSIRPQDVDWRHNTIMIHGKGDTYRLVAVGRRGMKAFKLALADWPISKSRVKRILDELGERAHVQGVYPHRFRVTRVCDLLDGRADPLVVSTVAGHSLEMVGYYQRAIAQRRALDVQRRHSLADRIAG